MGKIILNGVKYSSSAKDSDTVDGKHASDFVNKAGDSMIGDLGITYAPPNISDIGTPAVGGVILCDNLMELKNYRGFLGTCSPDGNSDWNNVISSRHRNGHSDGQNYGMYLRCPITTNEDDINLYWRVQCTDWHDERVLLDSYNYKKFCTPKNIGALSLNGGQLNSDGYLGFSEDDYCDGGYYKSALFDVDGIGFDYSTYQEDSSENLYETDKHSTKMSAYGFEVTDKVMMNDTGIYPEQSNLLDIGKSSFKWNNIYAVNGTIQISDKTKKKNIKSLDIEIIKAFIMGLIPCSYEMVDGTSGRTHWGFIAQDIEELMNTLNMDGKDFAGFIKSPKKIVKHEDENGNKLKKPVEEIVKGEYDYALRYDEFIAPIISVVQEHEEKIQKQQETINKQQKEIEELKKEMKELKEIVLKIA